MKNEPFCEALKMFLYPGFTRSCFVQLGRDLFLNVVNSGFLAMKIYHAVVCTFFSKFRKIA